MSRKDKKIEIQLQEAKVTVNNSKIEGFELTIGKKLIGQIAEIDEKFAVLKNGEVHIFQKTLDAAVESVIENYNLNH
ncbi:DUF2969 domain-containing protein [Streptococcus dentiloxodontae]